MRHDRHEHRKHENEERPADADLRGLFEFLVRFHGHEPDDDVRHTGVAETPAETGENVLPRGHHVPVARRQRPRGRAAFFHHAQRDDRRGEERAEHKQPLEKVRPAHGVEAAEERVPHDDDRRGVHGDLRRDAENGFKKRTAGLDAARGIHGVRHEEDHRADDLQRAGARLEPVRQVLRDRDRVAAHDGKRAQPRRNKDPAERIADEQPHRDPRLAHAVSIDGRRHAHEHPRAHVARTRRKAGHPRAHFAPAEEVVLLPGVLAAHKKPDTDTQHKYQIKDEHQKLR